MLKIFSKLVRKSPPKPTCQDHETWVNEYARTNIYDQKEPFKKAFIKLAFLLKASTLLEYKILVPLTWEYLRARNNPVYRIPETPLTWLFLKQGFQCGQEHDFLEKKQLQYHEEETLQNLAKQNRDEQRRTQSEDDLMGKVALFQLHTAEQKLLLEKLKRL